MNLLNKLLCCIGMHDYEWFLEPKNQKDSFGFNTYWGKATHKCKHCGRVKR